MAVIKDYMDGECRIIVHDDYIQPPEKVREIVKNVSRIVINEEFRKSMEDKNGTE